MKDKTKNIVIVVSFFAILLTVLIVNIIKKDEQISVTERRKLAQFPDVTVNKVLSGKTSEDLEEYVTDQFIQRDLFKQIKHWFSMDVLRQQDNNNLFVKDGAIYKMEYPLDENAVEKSAEKMQKVYQKYLKGMNVYYSVIPDKNYYLNDNHLKIDYAKLEEIMSNNLQGMKYIDIKSSIDIDSFYRTDLHWKQEKLSTVANTIKMNMNLNVGYINYNINEVGNFNGVYYGQVATKVEPDEMKYLTNNTINNCTTYNYETNKEGKIYDLEKYNTSSDKYDIFLSGATPLISIQNPNAKTKKELLLFRDSFGSSLAPLMIDEYSKITLIDIRYISSDLLEQYIEFKDQDVLFLYSGTVLNQNIFK